MIRMQRILSLLLPAVLLAACQGVPEASRKESFFNDDWKFFKGDEPDAFLPGYDDSEWRSVDLPHDWSIEGKFSKEHPTGIQEGALPAGIGWYRKTFQLQVAESKRRYYIDFDGIYRDSHVWINGHFLGRRPSGYSSFRYDLSPHLKYGSELNILAVKVDNSNQPNSRWYTGSGIYRNVRPLGKA